MISLWSWFHETPFILRVIKQVIFILISSYKFRHYFGSCFDTRDESHEQYGHSFTMKTAFVLADGWRFQSDVKCVAINEIFRMTIITLLVKCWMDVIHISFLADDRDESLLKRWRMKCVGSSIFDDRRVSELLAQQTGDIWDCESFICSKMSVISIYVRLFNSVGKKHFTIWWFEEKYVTQCGNQENQENIPFHNLSKFSVGLDPMSSV